MEAQNEIVTYMVRFWLLSAVWMIAAWLACGSFAGWVAYQKGRCGLCWFFWGLLFGPIALIAAAGLPPVVQAIEEVSLRGRPNRGEEPRLA